MNLFIKNNKKDKYKNEEQKKIKKNSYNDFDKRFDEKFGTGTDVFTVEEYLVRMKETSTFNVDSITENDHKKKTSKKKNKKTLR